MLGQGAGAGWERWSLTGIFLNTRFQFGRCRFRDESEEWVRSNTMENEVSGWWSRRLDGEHRLVYRAEGNALIIDQSQRSG